MGGYTSAPGVSFRREDRVVLTSANYVEAIAVSQRLVFSVTRNALAIYDRQFDAWQPPVELAPEMAAGRISSIAADPVEDAVWIGTFGTVLFYRPLVDVQISASVPGAPDVIFFDSRDQSTGAYVRAGGGWYLVSRVGTVTPVSPNQLPPPSARIRQPTLQEVYARYPSLQNFQSMMTRDEQMRSWPVTAVGTAPETEMVWLGTAGNGMYRVDPRFGEAEHVPFGLISEGAGALARAADGVWAASYSGGMAGRGGLTFVRTDLQSWRWLEGGIDRPFAQTRALDLAVRGQQAWVATDRGLFRLDTQNPLGVRRWSLTNGLPDDRALAVAAVGAGVWVGTARGLSFIEGDPAAASARAVSQTMLQGIPVRGLAASGDTIWAATDAGLIAALTTDTLPRRPTATDSRLRQPLVAVALVDSVLFAASENEVVALRGARVMPMPGLGRGQLGVGRVLAIAADSQTVWVAGDQGVAVVQRSSGVHRVLPVPSAIPAPALDIVLDPDFAWIATREGVVRLRRLPDGSVR
jgi:ligand-binding sensor domain-containing protein